MAFVFSDKAAAMASLVKTADPAAERFVRELLADRTFHSEALAGLAQLDIARGDLVSARFHAGRLTRLAPTRLDYATLNAALALAAGDHDAVLAVVAKVERLVGLDATLLRIAVQAAARGSGHRARLLQFASRLAELGALEADSREMLDRMLLLPDKAVGWISPTVEGDLVGAIRRNERGSAVLRWQCAGEAERHVALGATTALQDEGALVRFRYGAQSLPSTGRIEMVSKGGAFLGSPVRLTAQPIVLGAVEERFGEVRGWAWAPGRPDTPLSVVVTDELGRRIDFIASGPSPTANALVGASPNCGFSVHVEEYGLKPGALIFTASGVALSGSPVVAGHRRTDARVLASHRRAAHLSRRAEACHPAAEALARAPIVASAVGRRDRGEPSLSRPLGTAVLIPVYDGKEETLACLASVQRSVPFGTRIVVIDDASPDPSLSDALIGVAQTGAITLLRNKTNLGYPRSVNRGLAELQGHDVVLLNADSLVANDWLDRLRAACYREPDVGTVTALAPSGSIASYGVSAKDLRLDDVASIDIAASDVNRAVAVDVPTGVGHCLFIRAACLAEVGMLDAETFARGYGEENDFCLRARATGWRNVVAADVFVGHIGERSFGSQRRILSHRNGAILERLYPDYDVLVQRHIADDPLAPARRKIDLRRIERGSPAVLIITMAWKGGVAAHVEARAAMLQAEGQRVLQLQPVPPTHSDRSRRSRLVIGDQADLRDLVFDDAEFVDLVELLRRLDVARIEIHHTLHHDARVLDLSDHLGVPYEIVVHDYSWICPRMALVGGSGTYCGVPDDASCDRCVASFGSLSDEPIAIGALRDRSRKVFEGAADVIVPCKDVFHRLQPHVGDVVMTVKPWDEVRPSPRIPRAAERLRVVTPGGIGLHKGFTVLKACAEDASRRDLPIDFIVIGYSEDDDALLRTGRVFITGEYEPDELAGLIVASRADVALLPSVCPETWSYTLSEVWRNGLEALSFDIGAIAERLRAYGGGRVIPLDTPAFTVNDFLLGWKLAHLPGIAANATRNSVHLGPAAVSPTFSTPKANMT